MRSDSRTLIIPIRGHFVRPFLEIYPHLLHSSKAFPLVYPLALSTSGRIQPLTKKQESPYQISLDIPFKTLEGQSDADEQYPRDQHNREPLPLDAERTNTDQAEVDHPSSDPSGDGSYIDLADPLKRTQNGTQISLLDHLARLPAHPAEPESPTSPSQSSSLTLPATSVPPLRLNPAVTQTEPTVSTPVGPASISPTPTRSDPASPNIHEPYLLPAGTVISSPGGHFSYRILGACCRLFDRDELPWPCCRIQWRSKEPSWRRIGKRFVPDLATKRFPSYIVEILDHEYSREPFVLTLYWLKFPSDVQNWWYTKYVPASKQHSDYPQN